MTRILIIEGDTPDQLRFSAQQNQKSNAQYYQDALLDCQPDLQIETAQPYHPSFKLQELNLDNIDGVVFTGSTVNWSVDAPEAKPIRATMEKVFTQSKPTLGSCNGMQLGAVILGGRVAPSPNGRELGMARNIRLTSEGAQHSLHLGREDGFACSCIHRDEVAELPSGAILTATNDHSPVQAMVYERNGIQFWGMQYHPEISPKQIAALIAGEGLFTGSLELAENLRAAEENPLSIATQALKVSSRDLLPNTRMLEIKNWLAFIQN